MNVPELLRLSPVAPYTALVASMAGVMRLPGRNPRPVTKVITAVLFIPMLFVCRVTWSQNEHCQAKERAVTVFATRFDSYSMCVV